MQPRLVSIAITLCIPFAASADSTRLLQPVHAPGHNVRVERADDKSHFTFILSGDNRSAGRGVPMPPTLERVCTEIGLLRPAFTLWTGDTIYGSDDTVAEADAEYDVFLTFAAKTETPVYNAPGNHEIFDRSDLEALYQKRMGLLYGSFDYGNSHFIALNTEEIGLNGGIGKQQGDWLEQDLEANRSAEHIFAFMHHPMFAKPGEKEGWADSTLRDRIHALFLKYGVKNVFSGHEHLYYHGMRDGINYYISGGAGAPADASPEHGGYQHYVLFTVDGDKVTPTILQPWRLFAGRAPGRSDSTVLVSNYNNDDLDVCVELPKSGSNDKVAPTASSVYKGQSKALTASIIPGGRKGFVTVRVKVPAHRSAIVSPGGSE
jgi:3',5'-cyclic AMP phosphodiesterase CpdA